MTDIPAVPGALPPAVTLHLAAALIAISAGPIAIFRRRRDRWHRGVGYLWVAAMVLVAASSFAIPAAILPVAGGFGVIHLLSLWVFWTLWWAVRDARDGRIAAHRARMAGLYWQGLTVAGALTLLPGRLLNDALFGLRPELGFWAAALLAAGLLWVNLQGRERFFAPRAGRKAPH